MLFTKCISQSIILLPTSCPDMTVFDWALEINDLSIEQLPNKRFLYSFIIKSDVLNTFTLKVNERVSKDIYIICDSKWCAAVCLAHFVL